MIKELIKLAEHLDKRGLYKEADYVDWLIKESRKKKKMDAVGKEDSDIDNDGDVDSSDEYLAKRRKAISESKKKKNKAKKNS
jgi:hypothetical protein